MRRFLPHEIEYLSDPDRFTFDSFKRSVLDPLPPAAALGVADEELLNYYENALRQDGRFVLRLDPNGDHYERLERYVAETHTSSSPVNRGPPAFRTGRSRSSHGSATSATAHSIRSRRARRSRS
jgi:hypothetical protein